MATIIKDDPNLDIPDSTEVPADKWLTDDIFPYKGKLWHLNPDFSITKIEQIPANEHIYIKHRRELINNKYSFG